VQAAAAVLAVANPGVKLMADDPPPSGLR